MFDDKAPKVTATPQLTTGVTRANPNSNKTLGDFLPTVDIRTLP